ncbi:MAG: hypothetical protein COB24_14980 [Hyphomicrobiales bacterium]|nr:MAG: hypothetical protein COB24_14980 [Hyphomicrobiales bacterium]
MAELSDLELLDALGVDPKPEKKKARSAKEERIIAGFEEIQKFVGDHGDAPMHGEGKDIFERLYATRLDQIRRHVECRDLVKELDHQGLLDGDFEAIEAATLDIEDDELLSQLGVEPKGDDVTVLKHVRPRAEVRAAEEIGNRTKCEDFEKFKSIFQAVQQELTNGIRETKTFEKKSEIEVGKFFIVGGQKAYVAEMGEIFLDGRGMRDSRLRVIYDNGTESNLLLRSLQRALHKDEHGRRITESSAGPLFTSIEEEDDLPSGTIYVLRSKSDHPLIKEHRDVVHKIGVTGGSVEKRIAKAKLDPTFLMADVEIVATYKLSNINRIKMEKILHKVFASAKLNIDIIDRFGNPVSPQEWFLVPVFIVDEVVTKIREGTIGSYSYDIESASLKQRGGN